MYVLIITEKDTDPLTRLEILRALDHYGEWEVLANGIYAVNSHADLDHVQRHFRQVLGIRRGVSVVPIKVPASGPLPKRIKAWIKSRISSPQVSANEDQLH